MEDSDVEGALARRAEFRQEALRGLGLRKADPLHHDIERDARQRYSFRPAAEDFHRVRQRQLARDARLGVVISANEKGWDFRLVQAPQRIGKESRRLHGGLLAVVQIARNDERVRLLGETKIDDVGKGFARGPADQLRKFRLAQRERPQRRIEMDVGGVHELEWHGLESRASPRFGRSRRASRRSPWKSLTLRAASESPAADGRLGAAPGLGHSAPTRPLTWRRTGPWPTESERRAQATSRTPRSCA